MQAVSIVKPIRETLAFTLWTFICLKIFIFDIDLALVEFFAPQSKSFLTYMLFGIVGIITLLLLVLGTARVRSFVAYIVFYPLVIFVWIITEVIFHNWATVVVFSPAIYSILTTLERRLIVGSFALLGAVVMVFSTNPILVGTAMLILFLVLCEGHYRKRFSSAFDPSSIFADMRKYLKRLWQETFETSIAKQIQEEGAMDPASDNYRKKQFENLECLFMLDLAFYFAAVKLREVANNRKIDLYFILSLLYTFAFTVIVFALEYLALFTLDPGSFVMSQGTSYWLFLTFSFNTLMTADLGLIKPRTPAAILLVNVELFTGLLILIILVFVMLTIIRERYHEELGLVIEELGRRANAIETIMEEKYQISMTDTEAQIMTDNPLRSKIIVFLRGLKARAGSGDQPCNHTLR